MQTNRKIKLKFSKLLWIVWTAAIGLIFFARVSAAMDLKGFESVGAEIGPKEALLVAGPDGRTIYSKNADKLMMPASTIKILTSLAAFHYLGKDYRFPTEFYLDESRNLIVKGYGDPFLVSEEIAEIARRLAPDIGPFINEIIVNDSYFSLLPTVFSPTLQPYGAPNGALCVNFNTVNFTRGKTPGSYASAEPQTPLLPLALEKIKQANANSERIVLSHDNHDISIYAGQMFEHFLEKNGVDVRGKVWRGWLDPRKESLVHTHLSRLTLEQTVEKLLEFSNNFIANQILIVFGAKKYGNPGNFEKGIQAAGEYATEMLKTSSIKMDDGSGLSRNNRISANEMLMVLNGFKPHCRLLKTKKNACFKTGTLHDVNNLAGYLKSGSGQLYPFVVFINKKGKNAMPVLDKLTRLVN